MASPLRTKKRNQSVMPLPCKVSSPSSPKTGSRPRCNLSPSSHIDAIMLTSPPLYPNISSKSLLRTMKSKSIPIEVDFQSVLRIRPLLKSSTEQFDTEIISTSSASPNTITLKKAPNNIKKAPSTSPNKSSVNKYHFDTILGPETTQKECYDSIGGLSMVWDAINPLLLGSSDVSNKCILKENDNLSLGEIDLHNHVIMSMGVSNSGKTHTIFGHEREEENEGVIPRIIDDLFATVNDNSMQQMLKLSAKKRVHDSFLQSKKENNISFGVQISMVLVHNDHVYDMLSSALPIVQNYEREDVRSKNNKRQSHVLKMAASYEAKRSEGHSISSDNNSTNNIKELKIVQDPITLDFCVNAYVQTSFSASGTREILEIGMKQNIQTSTGINESSSRGHVMITLRPILAKTTNDPKINIIDEDSICLRGGTISIIDMAGIERTKRSGVSGSSMKESVAINSSISTVLQCLRVIKINSSMQVNNDVTNVENQSPNLRGIISPANKKKIQVVPYRQNKLTMIMQPLFSGSLQSNVSNVSKMKTKVTLLTSVYPGATDYHEKKSLLNDIDSLRGLSIVSKKSYRSGTNINTEEMYSDQVIGSEDILPSSEISTPQLRLKRSPMERITNLIPNSKKKKKEAEIHVIQSELSSLQNDNFSLQRENIRLTAECEILTKQNANLKVLLEKAHKREVELKKQCEHSFKRKLDDKSESDFIQERDFRRREQTLLRSPLLRHMRSVEENNALKNEGGFLMKKEPFPLKIPNRSKNQSKKSENPCTPTRINAISKLNLQENDASPSEYSA